MLGNWGMNVSQFFSGFILFVCLVGWSVFWDTAQVGPELVMCWGWSWTLGSPTFTSQSIQVNTTVPGSMFLSVSLQIYILFLLCDCKNLPGGNSFLLLVLFPESLYNNDKVWQPRSQAFSFYVLALLLNSIQPQSSCFISVYFLVCKTGMIRTLA